MHQEMCRFCLVSPAVSFSILETKILHMVEALALTKISPSDDISTIICLKCLLNLKLAYNLKQTVKKSEEKLLSLVKIKQEPQEPPTDLVQLCDRCLICGVTVAAPLINDHVRKHFNDSHSCDICEETFTDFQLFKEHSQKHNRDVFKCKDCEATFQYKTFLDSHCKSVHLKVKEELGDRIRSLGLTSKRSIRLLATKEVKQKWLHDVGKEAKIAMLKNLVKKNMEGKRRITCNICNKDFTKHSFSQHSHETVTCTVCDKKILKFSYRLHMQNHTSGPQVCHLCGATLNNRNNLRTHMFYSHMKHRYKCEHCQKTFLKKITRDTHVQKMHIGVPTVCCETCGKGFYSNKDLTKHVKMTHLKLRPHICEFCKKGFSSRLALRTHRRRHTNETPYRCEMCGEGFRQKVSLRTHRRSKHDIVEEIVCHCNVCGKGFASDAALCAHKRLHL